jgi:pimeloyl-ACP methyl ester carboxylesterase
VDIFEEWRSGGSEIHWPSSTAANSGTQVKVFSRRCGTPGGPALVCVHGFPTSSIDYFSLTRELGSEFEIFLLDFPGYGFSDKPPSPYRYSLYDDARLLLHAITRVWMLERYMMLTHDRGSSVGMIALSMLAAEGPSSSPSEVILTNANIYLPLANLTAFQTALLDSTTARDAARATTPETLAAGLGATTFMPPRTLADPEIAALAKCFAYNDGIRVLPDTIQYLHERATHETSWLEAISKNETNVALAWGLHDNVAPVRVANYVWQAFLETNRDRTVTGSCQAPLTTFNAMPRRSWRRSSGSQRRVTIFRFRHSGTVRTVRFWWTRGATAAVDPATFPVYPRVTSRQFASFRAIKLSTG